MKSTWFCQLVVATSLTLGGALPSLWAAGPADLEALAEKARQAAEGGVALKEKAAKELESEKAAAPTASVVGGQKPLVGKVKVDPAERAGQLGLLANISQEVSAVMTFLDGARVWEEVEESEMGSVLIELLAENDVDLTDSESPGAVGAQLLAEEILFAFGEGTSKQFENLQSLGHLYETCQIASLVKLMGGDLSGLLEMAEGNPLQALKLAVKEEPDSLVSLLVSSQMPPVLMAARVSDGESRANLALALQMGSVLGLEAASAEEWSFLRKAKREVGGVTFEGLEVNGKLLMEYLKKEGMLAVLEDVTGIASSVDIVAALSQKNLVLAGGVSDEAVYFYLGSDLAEIPLVANQEKSIAGSDHLAFVDPYLEKNLVNLLWVEKELVGSVLGSYQMLQVFVDGLRLGLKGNDEIGNTRKLMELLTQVETLEQSYFALNRYQANASLSYLAGDGLHCENFGGIVEGAYDWEAVHQLGSDSENSFLTVQGVLNSDYTELEKEYLEAFVATVYEIVILASGLEDPPVDMEDFKEQLLFFDKELKEEVLALWSAMRSSCEGLGNEFLFDLDLAGSMPTAPGLPQSVVDNGLTPRVSFVAPVTNRDKLGKAWQEMDVALTDILKVVSEVVGENIPMQKPMSSKNDGFITWFFPIPVQTDDFVPSVTIDDELMIMSTSKNRALNLAESPKRAGEEVTGTMMMMNFDPLREFFTGWLALLAEHREEIFVDEEARAFFDENEETIKALVNALQEFDSLQIRTWMEEGQLRSSSHFKTK